MKNFSELVKELPKIELHLHLDCSLSYKVVSKLIPGISKESYSKKFIAPNNCADLKEYIECASASIDIMQTKEQLKLVTLDLFDQLLADNVIYAEIRFAPLQHLKKGLTAEEVVQAVDEAINEGKKKTGIEARLILCTLRHFSEQQSMQTIHLVDQFRGSNVVGFDLAADEAGYPIDAHRSAFNFASKNNLPCTCHAGEALGAESVKEVVDELHVQRIGHGVRSIENLPLIEHLKKCHIHLEVCPSSNIKTNMYPTLSDHPVDKLYHTGVSMSINTDGRSLSDIDLITEYQNLKALFGWDMEHYRCCNLEAIKAAFIDISLKEKLKKRINEAYQ
ncbi:adenosine deaminase [Balneola vulgaris]|uniref:adenosine deaminase n=1 Tax=Balneola vulgaris TaxID=287535 RepID=UPI00037D9E1C|nr:adenosine deaminase [Balneola vulgaris]